MAATLPAVCENPKCRAVFFSTAIGGVATMIDCRVGPCPRCGEFGLVANGTYDLRGSHTHFTPESDADRAFLERALGIVRNAVNGDVPFEDFQASAMKDAPELSALWKLMPQSRDQAYQFWMLVFAVLGCLLMAYQTFKPEHPAELNLPSDVVDAIESGRRENRVRTRKEQRKTRERERQRRMR